MRKNVKKLSLKRETLRTLRDSELRRVAGGIPPDRLEKISINVCPWAPDEDMDPANTIAVEFDVP